MRSQNSRLISLPPENEVKVQPAKNMTNFWSFFGFFQPKCWSFANLAPLYDRKNYGQNMGQMYQKGQRTLGKAKGAKKIQENRLSVSFSKIPLIQTDMM